jgi:hypothetical protein
MRVPTVIPVKLELWLASPRTTVIGSDPVFAEETLTPPSAPGPITRLLAYGVFPRTSTREYVDVPELMAETTPLPLQSIVGFPAVKTPARNHTRTVV